MSTQTEEIVLTFTQTTTTSQSDTDEHASEQKTGGTPTQ